MKMKRIAAAMLAMITALSLSACGAPTESTGAGSEDTSDVQISTERTDEQAEPAESTTAPAVTETTEQTTTVTTTPAEPEAPVELPVLNVEPTLVMNGCMAFKCDGKNYVYNITENEMYETEYDVSEITVLKGCVAVVGDVSIYGFDEIDATVVNLKTGEQYADVKPFFSYDWNGDYLTVGTLKESFSGNTVSVGMLNDKGEWVLPLSAEHAICSKENIDKTQFVDSNNSVISFDGIICYDITTDSMLEDINVYGVTTDKLLIYVVPEGENMFSPNVEIYKYDVYTKEKTYIDVTSNFQWNDYENLCWSSDKTKVYDKNYNLLPYDLSSFNIKDDKRVIKGANENVIVFDAIDDDGDTWTVVLSANGEYVCEPFNKNADKRQKFQVYFSENTIVYIPRYSQAEGTDRIIDINTGEVTEYDDTFDIVDYDTKNNLMLVNTNGAYYLVDPEAPDVLINPFERAKN